MPRPLKLGAQFPQVLVIFNPSSPPGFARASPQALAKWNCRYNGEKEKLIYLDGSRQQSENNSECRLQEEKSQATILEMFSEAGKI